MKRAVKMRVTPQQSSAIQHICFSNGVTWVNSPNGLIRNTDAPYLFIGSTYLEYSESDSAFKNHRYIEVDAQQFINDNPNTTTLTKNVKLKVTPRQNEMLVKHCERLHVGVDTFNLCFADLPRYDPKDTYFFINGDKNIYYTSAFEGNFTESDFIEFTYEAFIANEPKYDDTSSKEFKVVSATSIVEPVKGEHEISFADIGNKGADGIFGITLSPDTYTKLSNGEDIDFVIKLKGKPAEKWRAKTKFFRISQYGVVDKADDHHNTFSANPGFNSKTYAEEVAKTVYSLKAIASWLEENDDGWKPEWNNYDQCKYYIAYSYSKSKPKTYVKHESFWDENLTCVYMSEANADKLCDLLNKGLMRLEW